MFVFDLEATHHNNAAQYLYLMIHNFALKFGHSE